jgi:hypothetical protein
MAAVAAAFVVVTALPGSAVAAPPVADSGKTLIGESELLAAAGLTTDVFALMRTQEALDALGERIQTAGRKAAGSGFTSVVVDAERNTLTVYWRGAVPDSVAAEVAAARGKGVAVVVRSAPYSEAQLRAEVDRLMKQPLRRGTGTDRRSMSAAPRADGTGIDVAVGGLPAGTTARQARAMVPALGAGGPIPLNVTTGGVEVASRLHDSPPPHWGGTFMQRQTAGNMCSNAFGVTGNNGAATYMLTAAHCGPGLWRTPTFVSPRVDYGNTIATRDLTRDGMAILTNATSGAYVYWGRLTNPDTGDLGATTGVAVADASSTLIGDRLCTSGALTGTVCDVLVSSVGAIVIDPPVNGVGFMPAMINAITTSAPAAGNGDSGGPVVAVRSDGRLSARGIISAINTHPNNVRPCPGWRPTERTCSRSVWFGDLRSIMGTIGVRINTP